MKTLCALSVLALVLLSGCATVGVLAPPDPDKNLADALALTEDGQRPVMAEPLIREAITIYRARGDQKGLGNAYRVYGIFFMSPAVQQWERWYRQYGFEEGDATFDRRFVKAVEYLEWAEPPLRDAAQFDLLTSVYYHLAFALQARGQHERACATLVRSLEAYEEGLRLNPTARPNTEGAASAPEVIAESKQRLGCQ